MLFVLEKNHSYLYVEIRLLGSKGENRETRQAIAVNWGRDGNDEKWSDSGYILKVELGDFTDKVDGVKHNSKFFGLSSRQSGVVIY